MFWRLHADMFSVFAVIYAKGVLCGTVSLAFSSSMCELLMLVVTRVITCNTAKSGKFKCTGTVRFN